MLSMNDTTKIINKDLTSIVFSGTTHFPNNSEDDDIDPKKLFNVLNWTKNQSSSNASDNITPAVVQKNSNP
jgi:hypothetical protein